MRYLPTPFHTKFAQERTALSQYIQQEAIGTRMRRWDRPIHDFLAPYFRGAIARITGGDVIPGEVQHRPDMDTLTDMLMGLGPFPAPHTYFRARQGRTGLSGPARVPVTALSRPYIGMLPEGRSLFTPDLFKRRPQDDGFGCRGF